mgnify:CR=1 FL=1
MTAKPAGSPVTLTDHGTAGNPPGPGDVLETSTGRRYLIVDVTGELGRRRLACVVMAADEAAPDDAAVYGWTWARR